MAMVFRCVWFRSRVPIDLRCQIHIRFSDLELYLKWWPEMVVGFMCFLSGEVGLGVSGGQKWWSVVMEKIKKMEKRKWWLEMVVVAGYYWGGGGGGERLREEKYVIEREES
ncbi:hypothetical protein HanRHA438_Chr04g0190291 [Helianthus annuus]|nr:hypothetical protein HanRHA438_Chr04g0190291 [Helianthus annuus]